MVRDVSAASNQEEFRHRSINQDGTGWTTAFVQKLTQQTLPLRGTQQQSGYYFRALTKAEQNCSAKEASRAHVP